MASRVYAFKDSAANLYYIFNSTQTSLIRINFDAKDPNYSNWRDASELSNLTASQLSLVSGLELLLYTYLEDDNYNVQIDSYSVLMTTDETHYLLKGYKTINSIAITGSTDCNVLLSFDGRKTWHAYNTTTATWDKVVLGALYTNGMTVKTVNSLNSTAYDKIFTKSCTLDYAISINTDQHIDSVVLNLPENSNPSINNLKLTVSSDSVHKGTNETDTQKYTHKEKVKVYFEITDVDDDDVTYTVYNNIGTSAYKSEAILTGTTTSGKIEFEIDPDDLRTTETDGKNNGAAANQFRIEAIDEYNAKSTATFSIIKTNENPTIAYTLTKNVINATITDRDPSDHTKWRVVLNNSQHSDWTEFSTSEPNSFTFTIPNEWIKSGETNTCRIEFYDDISDPDTQKVEFTFMGEPFGVLFVNLAEPELDENKNPNKYRYYSTALGAVIRSLNIEDVIMTKESVSHEVGLINNTSEHIKDKIVVKSDLYDDHYAVALSYTDSPFTPLQQLEFYNVANDEADPRTFFVKIFSYDKVAKCIDDFMTLETGEKTADTTSTSSN